MSAPALDRAPAPQQVRAEPLRGLLVLVGDGDDLLTRLAVAAHQARCGRRPVLVAIVEPPRPLTIDAAMQARHERRRLREREALIAEATEHCAGVPELGFVHLQQHRALTEAAARRAVLRKAQRIAQRTGYELFPA